MKNFIISYKKNEQFQKLIIEAENLEKAEKFFNNYKSNAILYGIVERANIEEELKKCVPFVKAK